jgi:hypothetical protein
MKLIFSIFFFIFIMIFFVKNTIIRKSHKLYIFFPTNSPKRIPCHFRTTGDSLGFDGKERFAAKLTCASSS